MQNPFTTTFSKIPLLSYIQRDEISKILENFSYDEPSESVYKIRMKKRACDYGSQIIQK